MERRIRQDMIDSVREISRLALSEIGRVEKPDIRDDPVALGVRTRQFDEARLDLDRRQPAAANTRNQRQSRSPHTRAKIQDVVAGSGGDGGSEKNGICSGTMPSSRLQQTKAPSEYRIVREITHGKA
jgi:hypothetical protein